MELWPYRSQLHAGIRRPPFILQRHCGRHMLESLDPIASFSAERSVATTALSFCSSFAAWLHAQDSHAHTRRRGTPKDVYARKCQLPSSRPWRVRGPPSATGASYLELDATSTGSEYYCALLDEQTLCLSSAKFAQRPSLPQVCQSSSLPMLPKEDLIGWQCRHSSPNPNKHSVAGLFSKPSRQVYIHEGRNLSRG